MKELDGKQLEIGGEMMVLRIAKYSNDTPAIQINDMNGMPYTKLSVNLVDEEPLPEGCFWLKDWSENEDLACELIEKGIISMRHDILGVFSGHVQVNAYEFNKEKLI